MRTALGLIAGSLCAAALMPSAALAQCAVCGNPAFAAADSDLGRQFDEGGAAPARLQLGVSYSSQFYSDLYAGRTKISGNAKIPYVFSADWALDIHLATLTAVASAASGTELGLSLPLGLAVATRAPDTGPGTARDRNGGPLTSTRDLGISDLELRLRQRIAPLLPASTRGWPQLSVSTGLVAPTGSFLIKGAQPSGSEQYTSLGRGVWWLLAEADLSGRLGQLAGRNWGWTVASALRKAVTDIEKDGYLFRWGTEVRTSAAIVSELWPDLLLASLGAEWQWRGTGQERVFADTALEPFANGGGDWLTLQPAVQVKAGAGFSLSVALRVPAWRQVGGVQPVPDLGGTVGLQWHSATAPTRPSVAARTVVKPAGMPAPGQVPTDPLLAARVQAGKISLVYWAASWCEACQVLGPRLREFAAADQTVALERIDVSEWDAAEFGRYLADAPALPVVDVYDSQRRLVERLSGVDAGSFEGAVIRARSAR